MPWGILSEGGTSPGHAELKRGGWQWLTGGKRGNLLRARVAELDGRRYDSQAERDYAAMLQLRERAGEICALDFQPEVMLTRASIKYTADFSFLESGAEIWVDVKGAYRERERFRVIRQLWPYYGCAVLRVVMRDGRRWRTDREIYPLWLEPDQLKKTRQAGL